MEKPQAYLANQFGFHDLGRKALDETVIPRIEQVGIAVIDPFAECSKHLDLQKEASLTVHSDRIAFWKKFFELVPEINMKLMEQSDVMFALLDGGHATDDGVAAECGFYANLPIKNGEKRPIIGWRSDLRMGEMMCSGLNAMIPGFIKKSGGMTVEGPGTLNKWFGEIDRWYTQRFLRSIRRIRK